MEIVQCLLYACICLFSTIEQKQGKHQRSDDDEAYNAIGYAVMLIPVAIAGLCFFISTFCMFKKAFCFGKRRGGRYSSFNSADHMRSSSEFHSHLTQHSIVSISSAAEDDEVDDDKCVQTVDSMPLPEYIPVPNNVQPVPMVGRDVAYTEI